MTFARGHALLIGVGSYANASRLNTSATPADATGLAAVLCDPQFCGYPAYQVTTLVDAAATRAGVLTALDTLTTKTGTDDTVVIFYAGHGMYSDDGYELTTHDTQIAGRKVVRGTAVSEAELIARLRAITAKRLLLIVNACHSGELSPVLTDTDEPLDTPPPPNLTAALAGTGSGRVIISACRDKQYSFIGPGPRTLFTQALIDGLTGKGVVSSRGYISVFDLYTHLYFTLDEVVPRVVPAATLQHYGGKQEPELTILKGVGPFAVALYRGAQTLGEFQETGEPPTATAVRTVNPAYSQQLLKRYTQQITNSTVGVAVAGDNHGTITSNMQTGGVSLGTNTTVGSVGDLVGGDKVAGDKVAGDVLHPGSIKTGNVSGTGIAIGPGAQSTARHITTGGGDYAEGNIDKRSGTFVRGDQYNMSGNFSGAILNIKSTLTDVSQRIGAAQHGDAATKAELQRLLAQLSAELQHVPAAQTQAAEAVAETAKATVEQVTKPQPNKTMVSISADGLKAAAQSLASVLPAVLPLAQQIADAVRRLIGG